LSATSTSWRSDLPGFGDSAPIGAATIPGQADVLEAELSARGIDTAHLAGNSSGAWLALEMGRRGRARTVVALAPAGMWTKAEDTYRYLLLRNAHYSARLLSRIPWSVRTPARRWLLGWWLYMAKPGRWSYEQAADQVRKLGSAPSFMEFLRWTKGRRVEGLSEVTCPVLIGWGSRDLLLPRRQAPRFVRSIPNARFRLLPGVGHVPMADEPQLVAQAIRELALDPALSPGSSDDEIHERDATLPQ
jgi:pimeloyl-ACP methyl ester carboxylesterase